jgi:CxxC-x17-CxxC domain-containing protein
MTMVNLGRDEHAENIDGQSDSTSLSKNIEMSVRYMNCADCGTDFCFTPIEKKFFEARNFENEPRRCHNCRVLRRARNSSKREGASISAVVCASCYCFTYVPFKPNGRKPIYCTMCLHNPNLQLCI